MTSPDEFVASFPKFAQTSVVERIVIAGYFLHIHGSRERFDAAAINGWFDAAHLPRPSNTSSQMNALAMDGQKRLLKDRGGFRLSAPARTQVRLILPEPTRDVPLLATLTSLEARVADVEQRTFLLETNLCFRHGAYRAAIVMAWNLAYHHFCSYLISSHLIAFNAQLKLAFPKKHAIVRQADFEDLLESQVIEVAKGAQIITKSTAKVLTEKLNKRNSAAHPSSITILPVTAEEVISDLVENILLKKLL